MISKDRFCRCKAKYWMPKVLSASNKCRFKHCKPRTMISLTHQMIEIDWSLPCNTKCANWEMRRRTYFLSSKNSRQRQWRHSLNVLIWMKKTKSSRPSCRVEKSRKNTTCKRCKHFQRSTNSWIRCYRRWTWTFNSSRKNIDRWSKNSTRSANLIANWNKSWTWNGKSWKS